jgi:hypothetical protein
MLDIIHRRRDEELIPINTRLGTAPHFGSSWQCGGDPMKRRNPGPEIEKLPELPPPAEPDLTRLRFRSTTIDPRQYGPCYSADDGTSPPPMEISP